MKFNKKTLIVVVLCFGTILSVLTSQNLNFDSSLNRNGEKIYILYDNTDDITSEAASNLEDYALNFAEVEKCPIRNSNELLNAILTINSPIIYLFHGNKDGWSIGEDFVTNQKLIESIAKSPSKVHFMGACESESIASVLTENKHIIGMLGQIDTVWATLLIKKLVLNYYESEGFDPIIITKIKKEIDTYVKNDALNLISLLIQPKNPLFGLVGGDDPSDEPTKVYTIYDSSYIGPSGLYSIVHYVTTGETLCPVLYQMIIDVLNQFNVMEAFDLIIVWKHHYYKAKVVRSWVTERWSSTGNSVWYTFYSSYDWVEFSFEQLEIDLFLEMPKLFKVDGVIPTQPGEGMEFSLDFDIKCFGNKNKLEIYWRSDLTFTNPAANAGYTYELNRYLTSQKHKPGWNVACLIDVGYQFKIHFHIYYGIQKYSFSLFDLRLAYRIDFKIGSSGNMLIRQNSYIKFVSGIDVDDPTCQLHLGIKSCIVIEYRSNFEPKTAHYWGCYFELYGDLFGLEFNVIFDFYQTFWNYMDISTSSMFLEFVDLILN